MPESANLGWVRDSIQTIQKTSSSGLKDTYTMTFKSGSQFTFEVTNGATQVTSETFEEINSAYKWSQVNDFFASHFNNIVGAVLTCTNNKKYRLKADIKDEGTNVRVFYSNGASAYPPYTENDPITIGALDFASASSAGELWNCDVTILYCNESATEAAVPESRTIAGIDLEDDITKAELQNALDMGDLVPKTRTIAGINLVNDIGKNTMFDALNVKGFYNTLADLQSAYPSGNSNIYVAGGHWYYWNGSAWTDGGAYAIPIISRPSLDFDLKSKTDLANQTTENAGTLKSEFFDYCDPVPSSNVTLSNKQAQIISGYVALADGDSTYKMLSVDNPISGLVKISCTSRNNESYGVGFVCVGTYTNDIIYAYYYTKTNATDWADREVYYYIPANVKHLYINARYDQTPSIKYVNKTFYSIDEVDMLLKKGTFNVNFTPVVGAYISARLTAVIFNANGSSSKPMKILKGDIVRFTAAGYEDQLAMIATCNPDYTNISVKAQSDDNTVKQYTYIATDDCYIVVSYINTLSHSLTIERQGNNYVDLSLFKNFGVVGDSYASGELYYNSAYHDKYDISWGQILARGLGTNCINFSKGGLTTRSWLTDSNYGLALMLNSSAQDIYYLCLGINDYYSLGANYLGSLTDITSHSSYEDYADSFYGNYGRIIEQILEHAPYAKIVMVTMAENAGLAASFNNAIIEIANHYNIPYIIQSNHPYFLTNQYLDMVSGHPRALGYSGMAKAFKELIEECVKNNYNYFKDLFMHN